MKKINRSDVMSIQEYEKRRDELRPRIFKIKEDRRIHVGPYLTFLFENRETVLYQIQEMMRSEKMQGEKEILHEIETYNELIGERGEVCATLMIEIEDKDERAKLLSQWLNLPEHLYLKTEKGNIIPAIFDLRQVGEERISSVHYLKFRMGDQIPQKLGSSHPAIKLEVDLKPNQKVALCQDLVS